MSNPKYQEWFDTAARGIISQGKPSMGRDPITENEECVYRSPDGCKCAIGWLIPDDKYDPSFERSSYTLASKISFLTEKYDDISFLGSLQLAHDNAAYTDNFLEYFIIYMEELAHSYDLSTDVLNESR